MSSDADAHTDELDMSTDEPTGELKLTSEFDDALQTSADPPVPAVPTEKLKVRYLGTSTTLIMGEVTFIKSEVTLVTQEQYDAALELGSPHEFELAESLE